MFENNSAVGTSPPTALLKKTYTVSILSKSLLRGQSRRYKRLAHAVRQQELTTSLEILAESQIEGDLALFILANFQQMGVA
ncbi:hypothetical protein H6G33_37465 [Calothrix sp. FACHB-1219]|uniref:hypothetical protein n=1 Tax=unclassified Calothrix TaxID=2619626 RepID=UPI001688B9A8|nr:MULTISPECIES: hypothetical protein [unclassified Calothrix]MBD2208080.1 hypothetical protein [Calothrix sp. FACHB-168]MBD2222618.1 hypothetical protein [Calothrix sp. FACHB-1219]